MSMPLQVASPLPGGARFNRGKFVQPVNPGPISSMSLSCDYLWIHKDSRVKQNCDRKMFRP